MSTKTDLGYGSDSSSRGIMGSQSPAALLDMLAEVASQTLHSEKKYSNSLLTIQYKPKTDITKKKSQEVSFSVPQLLSMPPSQLVKQFSIFTSDELKRQYSYTCALVLGCGQKYTSFASEGKARLSIRAHLVEHLEYLRTNKEAYNTFTAKSINHKNNKTNIQNKKGKLQQPRKPQETLNKENKNVIVEKPTNYLRKILLNDLSFKELDKYKDLQKSNNSKKLHHSGQRDSDKIDFKVLGDHSYSERLRDEMPNSNEELLNKNANNNMSDENIVFMVVGSDSVQMKEYSNINQDISKSNLDFNSLCSSGMSPSDQTCNKNTEMNPTKPKGKAKFIGTSKEEREMALAFMDHIKKKGNPSGNNLECRICNPPRSFTAPTTLVSHYRSHAGIKPYECRICRAVFTRRHSLKYHMLIHQNQTRFTCADCGKKFRHPSHFREHRRRHTGEAPFGCDDCGQRFKTRNTYKRHLKTRHGKVLTTTGDLLFLSDEDFQKVRTNRKKRTDLNKEHSINEDAIVPKSITSYVYENDQQYINQDVEEYIISAVDGDDSLDQKEQHTIRIINKCFSPYEVPVESQLEKTETIETDMRINNIIPVKNQYNLNENYSELQENLSQDQNPYDSLEILQSKEDDIIHRENVEGESELIYETVNDTCIKVSYSNDIGDLEKSTELEYENNYEFSKDCVESQIEIIKANTYDATIVYNDNVEDMQETVNCDKLQFSHVNNRDQEENCENDENIIILKDLNITETEAI